MASVWFVLLQKLLHPTKEWYPYLSVNRWWYIHQKHKPCQHGPPCCAASCTVGWSDLALFAIFAAHALQSFHFQKIQEPKKLLFFEDLQKPTLYIKKTVAKKKILGTQPIFSDFLRVITGRLWDVCVQEKVAVLTNFWGTLKF